MWRLLLTVVFICLSASASLAAEKAANPAGRAILVLDASGSMWGQIKGRTKVEVARESVARLMTAWNPEIELGLMAYGHRRKGDCQDIELVLPVAKQTPGAVTGTVNRLKAKGMTPLSAAVLEAAKVLRYASERATVILVSDGVETCDMDPCALAETLERKGVAFTAHVIGLDLKKEETVALQCLAEGTGGMFIEAIDAASLTKALTTVEEAVAAAPPAPKVPPATTLVAVLTKESPPLENREINWVFTTADKGPDGKFKQIGKQRTTTPRLRLETGKYRVVVQTGLVTAETTIDIDAEKPKQHVIDLKAGEIKLTGLTKEGGTPIVKNLRWFVNAVAPGAASHPKNIDQTSAPAPTYTLSAGKYQVVLQSGLARAAVEVDLKAGDAIEKQIYLNAGFARLSATWVAGGPTVPKGIDWYLTREKTKGVYENISHTNVATPTFTLGAGKHRFVAVSGAVHKVFEVEVKPDATTESKISLDAGLVTLKAINAATGKPFGKVYWTITKPETNAKGQYDYVTHNSYHTPGFVLSAGKYRVVMDFGGTQRIAMFSIAAGDNKVINIRVAQ